mmetsp:Transcript_13587/g.27003  ORF Transcript_13587/g.27003 Transcript_13587/m.27003 type:complete len:634 (+) Transcript_13587:46-1947(+)
MDSQVATIGTAAALSLAAAYVLFPRSSKNPFSTDARTPVKPFEYSKDARNNVVKPGYSKSKLEKYLKANGNPDAIVIGSGIGAMTTATIMAKAGKKVLVLEQHDQLGGCCHSFHEKGFEFDTGVHYVGEMRNNTAIRFLFDQLTNGQLQWNDVADDYDTVVLVDDKNQDAKSLEVIERHNKAGTTLPSFQCSMLSGRERTIKELLKSFPSEEKAIRNYYDLLTEVRKAMRGFVGIKFMPKFLATLLIKTGLVNQYTTYFKLAEKSLTEVLDELTDNKTLKAVLAYNFGDYGTMPKDAPFVMHAVLVNHFLNGVSYPVGGSSEFAYHMFPIVEAAGGKAFVRAEVDEIVCNESGAAVGVKLKKDGTVIKAPMIISNAGLYNTAEMLPPTVSPLKSMCESGVQNGVGGISVYVGLNKSNAELNLKGKHFWAFWTEKGMEDLDGVSQKYVDRPANELASGPVPLLFISFPSAKDPLWDKKHPGKSSATIVSFCNYDWFKDWENDRVMHRGEEYEERKKKIGELIWKQTVALFPQLRDCVEYFDVGTPVTNRYYIRANKGEMYGLDHNKERFTAEATNELRAETDIKNLYLCGQDIFNCGIAGAAFGGLLCASKTLGRNIYADLVNLKGKSAPSIPK